MKALITAELTRVSVVKELLQHLREPAPDAAPLEQMSNKDFAPPELAPHIKE